MTQTRRSFLKSSLAASTALALPFPAFAQDGVLNVALIVPSPAADVGWSHTLLAGTKALEEKYGSDLVKLAKSFSPCAEIGFVLFYATLIISSVKGKNRFTSPTQASAPASGSILRHSSCPMS